MTATASSPIGRTRHGCGAIPVAEIPLLRSIFFGFLLLLQSLTHPRKLIASALVAGLILAPIPAAFAQDRLELPGHADVAALDAAEHGHSHDDVETHEQPADHLHGHDPADHSHQAAFLAATLGNWGPPASRNWSSLLGDLPDPASGFGIDRPPKQALTA